MSQRDATFDPALFADSRIIVFRWACEPGWPVVSVSANIAAVLGYDPQELLLGALPFAALIHPDDLPRVEDEVRRALDSGQRAFTHDDYRVLHHDGSIRWVEDHSVVVRNLRGEVDHFSGYLVDVTTRRKTERALDDQRAILRGILDNIVQGLAVFDRDLRLVASNERFFAYLGYPRELAAPGTRLEDFLRHSARRGDYGGGDSDALVAERLRLAAEGRPHRYERRAPDGRIFDVTGNPMPGGGFVTTYTDVTERVTAERRYRDLARRHEAILDAAGQGIFGLAADGTITFVNREAERLTGYSRAELIGRNQHELMHHTRPDGAPYPRDDCPIHRTLADGVQRRIENEIYWRADGTWFPVDYVVTPFADGEGPPGAAVVFSDVTGRRRGEEELKLAKERADAAQKRLVDAIESISEGFALWDSDDRLVLCNAKFADFHGPIAHHLQPGLTYDEFLRLGVSAGLFAQALGREQEWIAEWQERHTRPGPAVECLLNDSRWIRVSETRTSDGGHVGVRSDVTAARRREADLADSERRYRELFAGNPAVQLLVDPWSGDIVDANDAAARFYGWPVETLRAMNISAVNTLTDDELEREIAAARNQNRRHFLFRHRLASGEVRHVEVHSGLVTDRGRRLLHSIIHDITDRRRAEQHARKLLRAIEQSPASVIITDPEGCIEYVNPKFSQITGYSTGEVLGCNPRILKSNHTGAEEYRQLWESITAGREWRGEFLNRRKDGSLVWESASISPVRDEDGRLTHFVGIAEDISARKEMEQRLHRLATTDTLTGLANRRWFVETYEREDERAARFGTPLALLMLDIDHFKKVNDTYGHSVGDEALKLLAAVCRRALREGDLCGRFGGEEFVALLPGADGPAAVEVAERIRALLAQTPVVSGAARFHITVSIGVTACHPGEGIDAALGRADTGLYTAKRSGRDRVVFQAEAEVVA